LLLLWVQRSAIKVVYLETNLGLLGGFALCLRHKPLSLLGLAGALSHGTQHGGFHVLRYSFPARLRAVFSRARMRF
jgi:hypothetical protein